MNGLTMNGWTMNGLSTVNGLSSTTGLMTTDGRPRRSSSTWSGAPTRRARAWSSRTSTAARTRSRARIGVAPEAINGPCDLDCQERISACMLAHVNNSGQHISIWLVGPDTGIGWGVSPHFPYQEGAFFGNIFASPWQGYYCAGKDMASGEVPGRLGTPLASNVYVESVRRRRRVQQARRVHRHQRGLHQLQRSRAVGALRRRATSGATS